MPTSDNPCLLFVYGTLMRSFKTPARDVLERHATYLEDAFIIGRLFDLGNYPGAQPSSIATDHIHGELYLLNDSQKILNVLDAYEDFHSETPERSLFIREQVAVNREAGKTDMAWVYWYNGMGIEGDRIKSGRYRK